MFARSEAIPLQYVYADMYADIQETSARMPLRLRARESWVRTAHGAVRIPMAGADAVRESSGIRRGDLHGLQQHRKVNYNVKTEQS